MNESKTLGDVLLGIEAGKSFQTSDLPAKEDELGVLKVSAVTWTAFRPEEAKAVIDYTPDVRHRVRRDDLLISRANTRELVGAVVLVEKDYPNRLLSDKTLRLVVDTARVDKVYLLFALRSASARAHIEHFATGTSDSMRNIAQGVISSIPILLPDLDAQREIAARLKTQLAAVEEARQAATAQLRELAHLANAIKRDCWAAEQELTHKFGEFVDSYRNGFGKRPEAGASGPIVLRIADTSSGEIDLSSPRRGTVSEREARTYQLQQGDLLFIRVNGARDIVGRCCVVREAVPIDTIFNDHLIRVRLKPSIDPEFAKLCFSLPHARAVIEEAASTSAGQLTISQRVLDIIDIPGFTLEEQREFAARLRAQLTAIEEARQAVEARLREIERLPQRLLAKVFDHEEDVQNV